MARKRATPEIWAQIRRDLGTDKFRQNWINPHENVLLGWWKICDYLGIRDRKTLQLWVDKWSLPAIKRPDGVWMTTMTAIDQWVMLAAQATHETKTNARSATEYSKQPSISSQVEWRSAPEHSETV